MLKNYLTQSYLYQFCPEPELTAYLWQDETDYSTEKAGAEQIVLNDFINRGYNVRLLRPELVLDTTDEVEDVASRNRVVVVSSTVATVTITGANDPDDTFVSCGSVSAVNGTATSLLTGLYKYYKYTTTASVTSVSLVETNYDLFYAYKWLMLILRTARGAQGDIYDIKANEFAQMYEDLFASAKLWIDNDEDGELTTDESTNNGAIPLIR